jgi:tetratricopeptide (TPR) repeat protein
MLNAYHGFHNERVSREEKPMLTGFRFHKEIDLLPWLKFNISKSGVSATIGPKDAHFTVGPKGTYVYFDLPGSGTYYRRKWSAVKSAINGSDGENAQAKADAEAEHGPLINMGVVDRIVASVGVPRFVDTVNALHEGNWDKAYRASQEATASADGAFLAGCLALQHHDFAKAIDYFSMALKQQADFGEMFTQFEVHADILLPLSEEVSVAIQPNRHDCLLALAEAYSRLQNNQKAIELLYQIQQEYGADDLVVRLLLCELYDKEHGDNPRIQHEIVALAGEVKNESPLHAALMYYRAKALRRLGVLEGARDTLTQALRKKKDYPMHLLVALQYERALLYEKTGKEQQAHKEFEKIYAQAPNYEDVAQRLGLSAVFNEPPPPGPVGQHLIEQSLTNEQDHAAINMDVHSNSEK